MRITLDTDEYLYETLILALLALIVLLAVWHQAREVIYLRQIRRLEIYRPLKGAWPETHTLWI